MLQITENISNSGAKSLLRLAIYRATILGILWLVQLHQKASCEISNIPLFFTLWRSHWILDYVVQWRALGVKLTVYLLTASTALLQPISVALFQNIVPSRYNYVSGIIFVTRLGDAVLSLFFTNNTFRFDDLMHFSTLRVSWKGCQQYHMDDTCLLLMMW